MQYYKLPPYYHIPGKHIQELLSLGYSHRKIVQKLHRNRSSLNREIHRNLLALSIGQKQQNPYTILSTNTLSTKGNIPTI